jgi:23S rRNA-/tRNA-specific pseudouridylate synthase
VIILTNYFADAYCVISAAIGFPIVGDPTYSLYGEAAMFGGLQNLKSLKDNSGDALTYSNLCNRLMARCSMDIMKAWTVEYPPNDKPMCLHAAFLQFTHPVTGELCQWNVRPDF